MKAAINKEDFEKIVKESNSKSALADKLELVYSVVFTRKCIKKLFVLYHCSTKHFELGKNKRKYEIITKICQICKKEFETQLGHSKEKTTCSIACSNSFQPKQASEESKNKTSESLKKFYLDNPDRLKPLSLCLLCGNSFRKKNRNTATCSKMCSVLYIKTDIYRNKLKLASAKRIAEGKHKGWSSRDKLKRSFPEQYIEAILEKEFNIIKDENYISELKCGKWFIDFAFNDKKIALEIDGKQHEYPERKASDIEKDKFLVEQGWRVHRIKWKGVKTKDDREAIISTLKQILEL